MCRVPAHGAGIAPCTIDRCRAERAREPAAASIASPGTGTTALRRAARPRATALAWAGAHAWRRRRRPRVPVEPPTGTQPRPLSPIGGSCASAHHAPLRSWHRGDQPFAQPLRPRRLAPAGKGRHGSLRPYHYTSSPIPKALYGFTV